jgi:hypothetical protein
MGNVVSIWCKGYAEKVDLRKDKYIIAVRKQQRDIAAELRVGYIKLLTAQANSKRGG